MKSVNNTLVSSICALIIGTLLVVWPGVAVNYLVITIGVLFLLPGLLGLFTYLAALNKRKAEAPRPVFRLWHWEAPFGNMAYHYAFFFCGGVDVYTGRIVGAGRNQPIGQFDFSPVFHAGAVWSIYRASVGPGSGYYGAVQPV